MEKHCLNLEDISDSMSDSIKAFFKKTGNDTSDPLPEYTCKLTGKMCVANIIDGKDIEYIKEVAERCPSYFPPED